MNYFEFYAGDYSRDTAELSLAEHGAFLLLLSTYYSTEKPLPAEVASLYRIARAMTAAEQKAVRSVADQFFPVADDGLRHNRRADAEIEKAQKRIEAAQANGRKGGRPPKTKPSGNPVGFERETEQEPGNKAHQTPHAITPPDTSTTDPALPRRSVAREGVFEGHTPPAPNPAAAHAIALNRAGVTVTTLNPDLIAFVNQGGTPDQLTDLVALPEFHGKPAAYVIRAALRMLADGSRPVQAPSARAGPQAQPNVRMSKTAMGIASLEQLKNDAQDRLAAGGDCDGFAETRLSLAGPYAGR